MVLGGLPNLKACEIPDEAGCALSAINHLIEDISRRRSGAVGLQGATLKSGTQAPDPWEGARGPMSYGIARHNSIIA